MLGYEVSSADWYLDHPFPLACKAVVLKQPWQVQVAEVEVPVLAELSLELLRFPELAASLLSSGLALAVQCSLHLYNYQEFRLAP